MMRTRSTPKYLLGSDRKLPPVFYNKICSWKFCNIHKKMSVSFKEGTLKQLCWKETPTQVFSCEYCGIFKITYFEEHLRRAAFIRCYFDTINQKKSGFCTANSFRILVSEQKYKKKIWKIVNLKKFFYNSHIYIFM